MNAIEQGSIKRFKTQEESKKKKKIKSITRCKMFFKGGIHHEIE